MTVPTESVTVPLINVCLALLKTSKYKCNKPKISFFPHGVIRVEWYDAGVCSYDFSSLEACHEWLEKQQPIWNPESINLTRDEAKILFDGIKHTWVASHFKPIAAKLKAALGE